MKRRAGAAPPSPTPLPPMPPHVAEGIQYARDVLAGAIPAGVLVKAACARFERDLAAAQAGTSEWEFRPDLAEWPIEFAQQLPNIKGPLANTPLRLLGFQKFIFAALFGFVERGTTTRRFRQAVIFVPRGNGKTTLAAPISLFLTFAEGEGGAEGYAAAVTRSQAAILFDTAKEMVRRSPGLQEAFGVKVSAHAIYSLETASKFRAISSDAKALDGLNLAVGTCDEIASHKTSEVYDVLLTAMGKRRHPLLLSISTATGNNTGIGKTLWDYAAKVVQGQARDDRLFALIYAADEADDPWQEATWIKANPAWGVAVQPDAIRAIMRQARSNPAQEAAALTRHLNRWVGADEALISMRSWRAQARPAMRLEDLEGETCYVGLDLASRSDLAAASILFVGSDAQGRPTYRAFCRAWLNEGAVMEARNASYPAWAAEGWLQVTPGDETDFSVIEEDILDLCRRFDVREVAYDPWQATQLAQRLQAEGVRVVEFRATTAHFSEPTKELDAAVRSGRLTHQGSPVLDWCVGNVVGRYDARGNVYPKKQRPEQKIDAAVALIMSLGRSMNESGDAAGLSAFLARPLSVHF